MYNRRTVMGVLCLLVIVARLSAGAAIRDGLAYTMDAGILSNTPGNHGNDAGDVQEDYMEMLIDVDPISVDNGFVNRHNYTYVINNVHVCSDGGVFVLALIKSSPESLSARQNVRNTWGSVKTHDGANIKHVFIMGAAKAYVKNDAVYKNLVTESGDYGDIVQGDFTEHFRNQTYKTVMGLTWARRYCNQASFILNTNDQTLVDPYHLVDFLSTHKQSDSLLYCSTFLNQGPKRSPSDKLFVTLMEYPYHKFPPHCEGFANVISNDVMAKLLDAAVDVPFFWIDDVYVTGFLALKADVRHTDMIEGHAYSLMQREHIENDAANNIFLVAVFEELLQNWDLAWQTIVKQNNGRVS